MSLHCDYLSFIEDPLVTIEDIYKFTDTEFSGECRENIDNSINRSRTYKSTHTYTLQQFGLDPVEIHAQLNMNK